MKNLEFSILTTPADQTRLTHAYTAVSAYRGNFTAKLLIVSLLNRSQASVVNHVLDCIQLPAGQFFPEQTVIVCSVCYYHYIIVFFFVFVFFCLFFSHYNSNA